MRNRRNGFSMVELLITLIICAVLMLIVGAISTIANSSYEKERQKAEIYNNIYYGFNLLKYEARNCQAVSVLYDPDLSHVNSWDKQNELTFTRQNGEIVTFKKTSDNLDFVYTDNSGEHKIIQNVTNLTFDFSCRNASGNWVACDTNNNKVFHVILGGEKNLNIGKPQGSGTQGSVKFNISTMPLSTDIMRRN